jgi:predicted trehalose synthase
MSEQQNQVDVNRIGCRIVDVHSALQVAFESFAQSGEATLEGLAQRIQVGLSEMPVFIIGDVAPTQE